MYCVHKVRFSEENQKTEVEVLSKLSLMCKKTHLVSGTITFIQMYMLDVCYHLRLNYLSEHIIITAFIGQGPYTKNMKLIPGEDLPLVVTSEIATRSFPAR